MSHEVETMAYAGQVPWHGLGYALTAGAPLETWKRESGLDYQVLESPVYFYAEPTLLRKAETRKVLYRSDTLEPLSVVSNGYKAVQPDEVLEFYRDLVDELGFEIETAGVLKGGLKVWAMANTRNSAFVVPGDEIKGYLLLATSYDGTFATTAQFTSVRVVCNNTLQMSLNNGEVGAVKVNHNTDFNAAEVKEQLGVSPEVFKAFAQAAELLANTRITAHKAEEFFHRALRLPEENGDKADVALRERWTQTFTTGQYIQPSLTYWGAVNVVTEYLDHVRRESARGNRLNSAWFGPGAKLKQQALQTAVEMVG